MFKTVTYKQLTENFQIAQQINTSSKSGSLGFCCLIGSYESVIQNLVAQLPKSKQEEISLEIERVRLMLLKKLNEEITCS